jgi:hypothetical protein
LAFWRAWTLDRAVAKGSLASWVRKRRRVGRSVGVLIFGYRLRVEWFVVVVVGGYGLVLIWGLFDVCLLDSCCGFCLDFLSFRRSTPLLDVRYYTR